MAWIKIIESFRNYENNIQKERDYWKNFPLNLKYWEHGESISSKDAKEKACKNILKEIGNSILLLRWFNQKDNIVLKFGTWISL